jgi:hypothetical protein
MVTLLFGVIFLVFGVLAFCGVKKLFVFVFNVVNFIFVLVKYEVFVPK